MKIINKAAEPRNLTEYRESESGDYRSYPEKDELREALVNEQYGLCCYCMCRISPSSNQMNIEHWRSRANYPDEQLKYQNLLGACKGGGTGQPPKFQHCDVRKGSRGIKYNPANTRHHDSFKTIHYGLDGKIYSDDSEFYQQLNDTLNLNMAKIKRCRKEAYREIIDWYNEKPRDDKQLRDRLESSERSPSPYPISIWFLKQKIDKGR